jgi:exodeoxyribonuclease VII large subunit
MVNDSLSEVILEVSDFVALVNQTLDFAYPSVTIRGELANFKISKNKWVYFDLKDEAATVRFFGNVYQLTGPLEDGMLLRVRGIPKLHAKFGFSVTITSLQPEGEGAIRRAADLLLSKLQAEGLFDEARKRQIPFPPVSLGLITSTESAAYADFIKVLNNRWAGIEIECVDVQVQGESAPGQIVSAVEYFNQKQLLPDVLVLTRGGGSAEDLYAFDTEQVTRAIASSRIPTVVAVGHERDTSLSELAADKRASTPSNAAELLVPDRREIRQQLSDVSLRLEELAVLNLHNQERMVTQYQSEIERGLVNVFERSRNQLVAYKQLLEALNPAVILGRGYAIVRQSGGTIVRHLSQIKKGDIVDVELSDGQINATVNYKR